MVVTIRRGLPRTGLASDVLDPRPEVGKRGPGCALIDDPTEVGEKGSVDGGVDVDCPHRSGVMAEYDGPIGVANLCHHGRLEDVPAVYQGGVGHGHLQRSRSESSLADGHVHEIAALEGPSGEVQA